MARLSSSGFELNSVTSDVEWSSTYGTAPSIQTGTVRSGTYALQVTSLPSGSTEGIEYQFKSSANTGPFYIRVYLRVATSPTAENRIILLNNSSGSGTPIVYLTLSSTNTLTLYDEDGQIGSASSALSANTWYRVEILIDATGVGATDTVTARLDGTNFASSSTRNLSAGIAFLSVGGNLNSEAQTQGDWYFDDIAINDSTGSFQNSWPGDGSIKHLRPNAAGDNTNWTRVGTDSGANWSQTDEVTPNNATDYVKNISTTNTTDDYNLDSSGLTGGDIISLVHIGARWQVKAVNASWKLGVKATSGGTVQSSANLTGTLNTWYTNANASPYNYSLTLYDLPGASTTAWTATELNTAQIRLENTGGGGGESDVTAVWMLVESTQAPGTTTSTSTTSTSRTTSSSTSTSTSTTSTSSSTTTSTSTSITVSYTTSTSTTTSSSTSTSTTSTSSSTSTTSTSTTSTSTSTTVSYTTSTSTSTTSTSSSTTVTLPQSAEIDFK